MHSFASPACAEQATRAELPELVRQAPVIVVGFVEFRPGAEIEHGAQRSSSPASCKVEQIIKGRVNRPRIDVEWHMDRAAEDPLRLVPEKRYILFLTPRDAAIGGYALADMSDGALAYDGAYEHFEYIDPEFSQQRPLRMDGPAIVTRIRQLMARESAASERAASERAGR